jgi:hypothetical protein
MSQQSETIVKQAKWVASGGSPNFIARTLDSRTVQQVAPDAFINWMETSAVYWGTGYRAKTKPPDTGVALVQSPYSDWYNLTWGLAPNADMPKWRYMFRARPEIRRGMDLKVILAVGRGFTLVCDDDDEIEQYANRLINHLGIREFLQSAVSDMLVYGFSVAEKVRSMPGEEQEHEALELEPIESRVAAGRLPKPEMSMEWSNDSLDVEDPSEVTRRVKFWAQDVASVEKWLADRDVAETLEIVVGTKKAKLEAKLKELEPKFQRNIRRFVSKRRLKATMSDSQPHPPSPGIRAQDDLFAPGSGELIELKTLDPLWMRVCRDAFGNVIGYVQWGLTPIPQAILSEKLIVLKWMPKSTVPENAYGMSVLMPVQRHISFLIQAEEDMKVFWHQYAKPMLVAYGGTQEKPYPTPQLTSLANKLVNRGPTTDVVMPGDTKMEMMQSGTGKGTSQTFSLYVKYLREKIYETLGIPSTLMNLPGDTTRATSDVTLQAFIAEEETIQDYIGEQVLKQMIEPEVRRHFADKYPRGDIPVITPVFAPVLEEDRNKKQDRVIKSVMAPIMTINEGRRAVGLAPMPGPPDDPDKYDRIPDAPVAGMPGAPKAELGPNMAPSKNPEISETERTGPREEMKEKLDKGNVEAAVDDHEARLQALEAESEES